MSPASNQHTIETRESTLRLCERMREGNARWREDCGEGIRANCTLFCNCLMSIKVYLCSALAFKCTAIRDLNYGQHTVPRNAPTSLINSAAEQLSKITYLVIIIPPTNIRTGSYSSSESNISQRRRGFPFNFFPFCQKYIWILPLSVGFGSQHFLLNSCQTTRMYKLLQLIWFHLNTK